MEEGQELCIVNCRGGLNSRHFSSDPSLRNVQKDVKVTPRADVAETWEK